MARCLTTIVQRAAARPRDELLDERAKLLRLGLGGLDGPVLNEGHGQPAHQGKLLLPGATKLPSYLAVPHYSRSSMRSSSGAFAAAWLGAGPPSQIFTTSPLSSYRSAKF